MKVKENHGVQGVPCTGPPREWGSQGEEGVQEALPQARLGKLLAAQPGEDTRVTVWGVQSPFSGWS